jgi:hypothetical protein
MLLKVWQAVESTWELFQIARDEVFEEVIP